MTAGDTLCDMTTGEGCTHDHLLGSISAIGAMLCFILIFCTCYLVRPYLPATMRTRLERVRPSRATASAQTEGEKLEGETRAAETRAAAAIAALPMRTIGADAQAAHNVSCEEEAAAAECGECGGPLAADECAICLSGFAEGQTATTLPCNHAFHSDCIRRWS